jgi:hypothetical protein
MNESRRLIDAKAAAELLAVPESWVRSETRADRLPHVPLGKYRRYDPVELEAWWRSRRRGPWRSSEQHARGGARS